MDGQTNGQMDKQMDRWMEGQTDRPTDQHILIDCNYLQLTVIDLN